MAQTALSPVTVARTGVSCADGALTAADVSNGNKFVNTATRTFILARNSGVTSRTVTIPNPTLTDGLATADLVVTLASGAEKLIGPFGSSFHQTSAANTIYVSGSHAEVLLGIFTLPNA